MKAKWSNEFKISNDQWNNIYKAKIINAFDKQVAEFNCKPLHNQLNCNYNVNKLNKDVKKNCISWEEVENTDYLTYGCSETKNMGKRIGNI